MGMLLFINYNFVVHSVKKRFVFLCLGGTRAQNFKTLIPPSLFVFNNSLTVKLQSMLEITVLFTIQYLEPAQFNVFLNPELRLIQPKLVQKAFGRELFS